MNVRRLLTRVMAATISETPPIPMILFCPNCGHQHVDAPDGDWTNPPHRSHLCHDCGHIWRPADVATNGVIEILTSGDNDDTPIRGRMRWRTRRK